MYFNYFSEENFTNYQCENNSLWLNTCEGHFKTPVTNSYAWE